MPDHLVAKPGRVRDAFESWDDSRTVKPGESSALPTYSENPLESRADVPSLSGLQAERRELIQQFAELELLFGSGGDRWTATRRRHRDGVAKMVRDSMFERWRNAGAKDGTWKEPSEALLERMANCDPRHTEFVERIEARFPEWLALKTELAAIEEKIRDREISLLVFNTELKHQG